ncbi:MAG: hypothetical protein KGZ79_00945 [Dethiobacter sp.]|jgi:hypothetical protein|nr:hypothetical protein [Dethiobacter sp.]
MRQVQLYEVARSRSGDKGDSCNIGLIARQPKYYQLLEREVTAERVKSHFGFYVKGKVERYEMPNIDALNFVLHGALNGGAASSIRSDNLGKCFSSVLLRMYIKVDEKEL